jgi:hypothetical protein
MAKENTQRDVGRVQAMALSCGLEGTYEDGWKRFVKYQSILPDQIKFWQAIADELQAETGYTPVVHTERVKEMKIVWKPGRNLRSVESGANADLHDWMQVAGWDEYVAENRGRAQYPATWDKARTGLLECSFYIDQSNIQRLCKAHGVGDKIAALLKNTAPWDSFNPRATETRNVENHSALSQSSRCGESTYSNNTGWTDSIKSHKGNSWKD